MKLRLIRSATILLEYAGKKFIIDPCLGVKHSIPSYAGKSLNPLVDLPCDPFRIMEGLDLAVISHIHSDHFDAAAQKLLPKSLPVFCQPGDQTSINTLGFNKVMPIIDYIIWENIKISRTSCQHGTGQVLNEMGEASGFVFENKFEPTIYWVGDTVWCDAVAKTISQFKPSIIITHSCGAVWADNVLIVMDARQTIEACLASPESKIIAVHMESFDHSTVSRKYLRQYAQTKGIEPERLLIPSDGEIYEFN